MGKPKSDENNLQVKVAISKRAVLGKWWKKEHGGRQVHNGILCARVHTQTHTHRSPKWRRVRVCQSKNAPETHGATARPMWVEKWKLDSATVPPEANVKDQTCRTKLVPTSRERSRRKAKSYCVRWHIGRARSTFVRRNSTNKVRVCVCVQANEQIE